VETVGIKIEGENMQNMIRLIPIDITRVSTA
jgi:hypothetical protein